MEMPALDAPKSVVVAGFLGSLLSMSFIDGMGTKQRIVAVIFGMVMSHYLAPFIAYMFKEQSFEPTIGFLVGLFGMSVVAAVFRAIQNSDIWAFIMTRFGKKAGEQ